MRNIVMEAIEHTLDVWGDFACWTRPELKVERWSYPCPTPSGARGIYDAIFCKPHNHRTGDESSAEFRWQVTQIELLSPPSYIALRRNEVGEVCSVRNVNDWIADRKHPEALFADSTKQMGGRDIRQQRQTMALRDVRFRVTGRIVPWPGHESKQKSLDEQFIRRASHGKCFHQPYLGCREFVAFYRYLQPREDRPSPCDWSSDIGLMVYDVFDLSKPGRRYPTKPFVSLFHAKVEHGVVDVPAWDDPRVLRPEWGAW
jgi:CRISPR-associated protein Cas5d